MSNTAIVFMRKMMNLWSQPFAAINMQSPYTIIKLKNLSDVPGETKFLIQLDQKNASVLLRAREIKEKIGQLDLFSKEDVYLINLALKDNFKAKLLEGRVTNGLQPKSLKILAKKYDEHKKLYVYTILTDKNERIEKSSIELIDENLVSRLSGTEGYEVGFTNAERFLLSPINSVRVDR